MRIAYLGAKGLPSKGGTERVLEAIVQRLAGRHEITVYCDPRYTPPGTTMPGVRLIYIPTIPGYPLQALSLFALSGLHALFFGRYDLVHIHSVDASFLVPLMRLRYPVITTAHGSPTRMGRAKWGRVARAYMALMEYPFLFLPNCATSVSMVDADHFRDKYGRSTLYIPNGVGELPVSSPEEDARILSDFGLRQGEYLLFAAARIDPTKGCHLVLEALSRLRLDIKLVIVGDLNQVPSYAQMVRQMADDRVVFVPVIPSKKSFMSVVRNCRLFVFPSLTEGMSMMLLEVASLGVPLVCSNIRENSTVLGEEAVYFESGDAADLVAKIEWALDNADEMIQFARNTQILVQQEFSWDQIVGAYETEYLRLVPGACPHPDDTVLPAPGTGVSA